MAYIMLKCNLRKNMLKAEIRFPECASTGDSIASSLHGPVCDFMYMLTKVS